MNISKSSFLLVKVCSKMAARINAMVTDGRPANQIYAQILDQINQASRSQRENYMSAAVASYLQVLALPAGQRLEFIEQGLGWIQRALRMEQDFDGILLKIKLLGFKIKASNDNLKRGRLALQIYKLLAVLEVNNNNNPEVLFIRGVLLYYGSQLTTAQKLLARTFSKDARDALRDATLGNALAMFRRCRLGTLENNFYLFCCYKKMKENVQARNYYNLVMGHNSTNEYERELQQKARQMRN
ncbi:hypothetical protein Mgra_00004963 [Meloidogyne graminicola]|uniref:Uncharacterized protein n=1 Tax=Meloidogyne graminicola TaxID=189291 RepID=A0A8S9ZQL9_9BILA|nr:hypothetical protein Mgra_00004963 [Meloidogyne graminicola]